jgi:predicted negative regulator of RcsB-dependent stress response
MRLSVLGAVATFSTVGCTTSLLAPRGDAHMANGRYEDALATYRAAIDAERYLDDDAKSEVGKRATEAAVKVTDARIAALRARFATEPDQALAELRGLERADWLPRTRRGEMNAAVSDASAAVVDRRLAAARAQLDAEPERAIEGVNAMVHADWLPSAKKPEVIAALGECLIAVLSRPVDIATAARVVATSERVVE